MPRFRAPFDLPGPLDFVGPNGVLKRESGPQLQYLESERRGTVRNAPVVA